MTAGVHRDRALTTALWAMAMGELRQEGTPLSCRFSCVQKNLTRCFPKSHPMRPTVRSVLSDGPKNLTF
ncbi:protein of unknown function [Paraburkholderia dioscoreae]|uniref:Uncharacterized protein n=1 Tax=Paraburkholderia dioscoreae TaxID=2604047 RepID=A0A5Q4Z9M2_9BURK|nr:protein of unknown function [Paraburkholderia dioscoreae]